MSTHTIEILSAVEKRISATVEAAIVKKAMSKAKQAMLEKKAPTLLKRGGFRTHNSVTQALLSKKITPDEAQAVQKKVQEQICSDSFSAIMKQEKASYEGIPLIEAIQTNPDGTMSYTVMVETYPDIPHVQWQGVTLEKLTAKPTEEAVSKMLPLLQEMGFKNAMQSQEEAIQRCQWIIKVFQHEKLRDQITESLIQQNTVHELPSRLIEMRYHILKQANNELNDEQLKKQAKRYITADILFKAYAKEYSIKIEPDAFFTKMKEATQNPAIMRHIKDDRELFSYLSARVFEETVIDHLVENAECVIKEVPLAEFMALAFHNNTEQFSEKHEAHEDAASTE
jgi:FKBP-type peptidyl-prolyl cis-trans isomerase (trigger factor)